MTSLIWEASPVVRLTKSAPCSAPKITRAIFAGFAEKANSPRSRPRLADLSRYLIPVALLLPAFLIGWVSGFLLLEDLDDSPLLAVDVTPIGKTGLLAYRLAATMLLTAAITALALQLLLPALASEMKLVVLGLVPLNAALAAIILVAVARNKVEGLALTKLTNIAAILPLAAAIPSPWWIMAGVVPSYWIGELLGLSQTPVASAGILTLIAIAVHVVAGTSLILLLNRRSG